MREGYEKKSQTCGRKRNKRGRSSERDLSDERILRVLKTDPQRGMTLLMEQYTGIVWKIISLHLNNPEDIRECVNETFAGFYFHRDKYDPGRASLPVYLSVIARRTAVSRYRRENRHLTEPLGEEIGADDWCGTKSGADREFSTAELRLDLERAMKELRPDEVQIIRMKYYGGMTMREIADSLNLPYETVKKRHHRSIHKMRRSLLLTLIILILLLLSACTYNVLRYYEIVPDLPEIWGILTGDREDEDDTTGSVKPLIIPDNRNPRETSAARENSGADDETGEETVSGEESVRNTVGENVSGMADSGQTDIVQSIPDISWVEDYGVVFDETAEVYTLMEPVVSESTYVTTTLTRAAYDGNNLIAVMEIAVKTGALEEAGIEIIPDTGGYLSVCPRFETISCGEEEWEAFWTRLPEDKYVENMSMVTAFSIGDISAPAGEPLEMVLSSRQLTNGLSPVPEGGEISFKMVPAESNDSGMYIYSVDEEHMIAARPEIRDGHLIVSVNPITLSGENLLSSSLVYGSIAYMHGEDEAVLTVTGEDGSVKTGKCLLWSPFSVSQYYEWDFGEAEPGTYTLSIPYYVFRRTMPEEFCLPIDFENCTWDEDGEEIPGGRIDVESITPVDAEPGEEYITESGGRVMIPSCPDARYWTLKLRVTSYDPSFPIGFICMGMETALSGTDDFCDAGAGFLSSSPVVDYGEQTAPEIAAAGKEGEISGPVSGTMEFFVVICTASRDPSASWLKFESQSGPDHVNYCQDAGAEISFRVEEQP